MRKVSHTQYDIKYHVGWITKYRYKILTGKITYRARELIRQSCETRKITIIKGSVCKDRIHLLISCPTNIYVSEIMKYLKGRSSKNYKRNFSNYEKNIGGNIYGRGRLDIFVELLVL